VVTTTIVNWRVHKILIDQGSLANVLYWSTFMKLNVPKSVVQSYTELLLGFVGQKVHAQGYVDLLTTFGIGQSYCTLMILHPSGGRHVVQRAHRTSDPQSTQSGGIHPTHGYEVPCTKWDNHNSQG